MHQSTRDVKPQYLLCSFSLFCLFFSMRFLIFLKSNFPSAFKRKSQATLGNSYSYIMNNYYQPIFKISVKKSARANCFLTRSYFRSQLALTLSEKDNFLSRKWNQGKQKKLYKNIFTAKRKMENLQSSVFF